MQFLKLCLILAPLPCLTMPVLAQRTTENVVTQSSDAFGLSVGNERTGLYSGEDVRGFSPVDAGNARIEGLYFDQLDRIPMRISKVSAVRVGISALGYPFPAPTGLIDYEMMRASKERQVNLQVDSGPFGGFAGSLEIELPLQGERLGISGGIGGRNQVRPEGGRNKFRNYGATLAWRPYQGSEILVFGGGFNNRGDEASPIFFPAGAFVPPRVKRREFKGQDWAERSLDSTLIGTLVRLPFGDSRIEAGLFRGRRTTQANFADLHTGVGGDGLSRRTMIADGDNLDQALSGEFRLVHQLTKGKFRHTVTASLRGREKDRLFGGTQRIALGPSSILIADPRPKPVIQLGPKNEDKVRQLTYGAAYRIEWGNVGSIDIGVSRSRYSKLIDFADPALPSAQTRDRPLLWNVGGSVIASSRLAFYAGSARGQEEALIAPDIASNRSEAPPAIRTKQLEAGLRYAITPKLKLVAGLFSIKKPYFNLDPLLRYRELGEIDNRGLEFSLAGQVRAGLNIVAGSVFLSPTISGEAVTSGQIGKRPVGQPKRRSIANIDWRTGGGKGDWSFDLALESLSSRPGNALNSFSAPARETVNIGARYRFALGSTKLLLRPQVLNLFNDYAWNVSSSGGFIATPGRTVIVQILADF